MQSAKSFAPGNISCIFVIRKTNKATKSGSLGLGFTVNKGVFAAIKKIPNTKKSNIKLIKNKNPNRPKGRGIFNVANTPEKNIRMHNPIVASDGVFATNKKNENNIIHFNNKKINFPTVNAVIEKLTDEAIEVKIESELPLGCGFGLSGASALATAYALNMLLKLKKPKKELAFIAHVAEVENGTGLGDVINQYYGGFLVKYIPSYKFKAVRLPIKKKAVYCKCFGAIETKKVISNEKIKNRINNAGIKALSKVKKLNKKNLDFRDLIKISKEFSIESGLLKNRRVIKTIKNIEKNNGNASMIMLGNAVFSDKYFKGSKNLIIKDRGACLC